MAYRDIAHQKSKQRAYYLANREKIIAQVRSAYQANQAEKKEYSKAHRKKNHAKYLEYDHKRRSNDGGKRNARRRELYQINREKFRADGRQQYLKRSPEKKAEYRTYRKQHLAAGRANGAWWRAVRMGAARGDRKAIKDFYEHVEAAECIKCRWCGKDVPRGKRHIDHVHPLSRGGSHSVENLAATCERCNCRKHNMMPDEFLKYLAECPE